MGPDGTLVEIPSPFAGVVLHHGASEGETVQVGSILAVIGEPGETWNADEPAEAPSSVGTSDTGAGVVTSRGTVRALPVVRKLAREHGVDLASVVGTGPGGKITREDVLRSAETEPSPAITGPEERVPMSRLRRTIAKHMERSWREIPHVTTFDEVDASRMLAARSALARRHERQIPLEALIVSAVIPVLQRFGEFNATLDGEDLVLHRRYDIGIAVDTPEGLIVPVVKGADQMSLGDLSTEVLRLSNATKERSLVPDEVVGQHSRSRTSVPQGEDSGPPSSRSGRPRSSRSAGRSTSRSFEAGR